MKQKSLGFIGGGRITRIFLQAFKNKFVEFDSIHVFDTNSEITTILKKQFSEIEIADSASLPAKQEIVFIALHPPVIMETLDKIKETVSENSLVVSLAPKIDIGKFESKLISGNIARMIPNATSYINQGYNPVCFSANFSDQEKQNLLSILELLGKTFEVEEPKLESYALISAMLPTYFWFQWKELQDIGMQMGLNDTESKEAINETLIAAIHLFYNSGLTSDEVIDLIPVRPIAEHEVTISEYLSGKLLSLFEKIKP